MYLIRCDISFILSKIKIIVFYLFLTTLYIGYIKLNSDLVIEKNLLMVFLGNIGGYDKINSIYQLSFMLIFFTFRMFFVLSLYTKDFQIGGENLFLRISKGKYFIYRLINHGIISLIFEMLLFVLLYIVYSIIGVHLGLIFVVKAFLCDLLVKTFFDCSFLLLYTIIKKYSLIFIIFILLATSVGKNESIGYFYYTINLFTNINMIWLLMLLFVIQIALFYLVFSKRYYFFCKGSD